MDDAVSRPRSAKPRRRLAKAEAPGAERRYCALRVASLTDLGSGPPARWCRSSGDVREHNAYLLGKLFNFCSPVKRRRREEGTHAACDIFPREELAR